ncbi:MAG: helix-turn-helix domain-containing protein, partial [Chloroflexota bacterium]|nr:helix-turn-helix domain-containing protein [Chloroflexota bacterium]
PVLCGKSRRVWYELIRPVVVFGSPPAERAQQTGVSASTTYRRVGRIDAVGMQSLFEAAPVEDQRALPVAIRQAIVQLKAEYPPFRPNELATICQVRFKRRPSRATIKKIVSTEPVPEWVHRRFPRYVEMTDPLDHRGAIVPLHAEGWNLASIAGYLETSRPTVYATLKRWIEGGVRGLADKPPLLTSRRVDQQGYVRFRNWRLYGERDLAGEPASIWTTDEDVTIQADDDPLATYGVSYQQDHRHFRQVTPKQIFETRHGPPQPPLLNLGPDDWLLAIEQPRRSRRRRRRSALVQAELFGPDEAVAGDSYPVSHGLTGGVRLRGLEPRSRGR